MLSLLSQHHFNQTYIRSHRMHVMTNTVMEAMKPTAADKIMTTSIANTTPRGLSSQLPHTGRQSEVFPTVLVLQEKPSWHWSMLQLTCPANLAIGGGWVVVSPSQLLPLPACDKRWNSYQCNWNYSEYIFSCWSVATHCSSPCVAVGETF